MYIKGTHRLSKLGVETDEVRALIQRRRLQVLVHSCLYYKLATSLVSDQQWQAWADELVELQRKYPDICKYVDYHKDFMDFDGSTGFHLPFGGMEILNKAYQLIEYDKKRKRLNGGSKSSSNRVVRIRI